MSVYKLYSASIGDAVASLDVVKDGTIEGVAFAVSGDLDADGETYNAEVSFASASGFSTNDTKSSFAAIRQGAADTGTATSNKLTGTNTFVGPGLGITVKTGERLYLHTAGTAIICTVFIYVRDGQSSPNSRRVRL